MFRHFARPIALALLCVLASQTRADDHAPPPLRIDPLTEQFMKASYFAGLKLSPDGKHLAEIAVVNHDTYVMMADTATLAGNFIAAPGPVPTVNSSRMHWRKPASVVWLANDLIGVNYDDNSGDVRRLDGKLERNLGGAIYATLRDDKGQTTDWVLVRSKNFAKWLERADFRTGEQLPYDLGVPGWGMHMFFDGREEVRAIQTKDTEFWNDVTTVTTWYRNGVDAPWQKLDERSNKGYDFSVVRVADQPGHLVVIARNGGDRKAVWDYDLAQHAFGAKIAADDSDDIVGVNVESDGTVATGFESDGMKRHSTWLDPQLSALQAWVDNKLPGHVNVLSGKATSPLLVQSYSDVDPGHAYVLDPVAMTLKSVLNVSPTIDPARMQPMQVLHYPSTDGLSIPAYLTLPGKPTKPVPMIVLIHGGPIERDHWRWDEDVQLFAAHGYAVFQPQFRGSTGFGLKFEKAGYQQFGLAMQDDVTAGVQAMIDQKIADPQRICIVGTSYGGYAALWGLAKTPDLYKCGVSTSGPSDIEEEVTGGSAGAISGEVREIWTETIGDPKQMKDTWASVSPRRHADRIKAPLLIVHGELDDVVPPSHGKKMRDAMEDQHKDVEWLDFPAEHHGVQGREDRRIWFGAMLELFARTIGEGEPPLPPTDAMVATAKALAQRNNQQVWLPRASAVATATAAAN